MKEEKLFKTILSLQKNHNKPDLHSFMARIKGGKVYVEGRFSEVFIREYKANSDTKDWAGTAIAATNRLELLEIDIDSIEF